MDCPFNFVIIFIWIIKAVWLLQHHVLSQASILMALKKGLSTLQYLLFWACTVTKVIDFPRYNMKCSRENLILCGLFHLVSRFPLHFLLYRGNMDLNVLCLYYCTFVCLATLYVKILYAYRLLYFLNVDCLLEGKLHAVGSTSPKVNEL